MGTKGCNSSAASMVSLSDEIVTEIMLSLPIKAIVMCKCTCKTLRNLISSTDFVKLHYARARPCILLPRILDYRYLSRLMYLVEPSNINVSRSDDYDYFVNESPEGVDLKLDTGLKLPIYHEKNEDCAIVNSCNGFLLVHRRSSPSSFFVCNPLTNEYINVPSYDVYEDVVVAGFGFCPKTKQYKVIRWLNSYNNAIPVIPEIHILGTNAWRSLVDTYAPSCLWVNECPVYFNGFVYWDYHDPEFAHYILSFDFETEHFRSLPEPPIYRPISISMGMMGDRLSLCSKTSLSNFEIWVIDNLGSIDECWSKFVSINIDNAPRLINETVCSPNITCCSKSDGFFLLDCWGDRIISFDSKRQEWRKHKIHRRKSTSNATMFTPSFLSLKKVAPRAKVKSISIGFVKRGEKRCPYLREDVSWRFSTR